MGGMASEYINLITPKFISEEAASYMQHSMVEIQNKRSLADNQSELMLSTAAQAKDYEQVDPYTLNIIATLFPSGGLEFLAQILRHATIKQIVLPELGKIEEAVAVINTRTLRTLASTIKWGYDTTHKYVTVFCALNLLRKTRHNKDLQIIFPLSKYQPPQDLHAIDRLISQSRPKVQQFTRKVKDRFLKLNLLSALYPIPNVAQALSECDPRVQQTFIAPMLEIIESEGIDPVKGQHIVFRLVSEVLGKILFPKLAVGAEKAYPITPAIGTQAGVYHPQRSNSTVYQHDDQSKSTRSNDLQPNVRPDQEKVYLQGRLFAKNTENSSEKSTGVEKYPTAEQKVYSEGRLSVENVAIPLEKSTDVEKYPTAEQKAYPKTQKESTLRPLAVDSMLEILHVYDDLLDDQTVDWEQMGLPKDFFEGIYEQMYAYYTRLHSRGLLARTVKHVWQSVELSIIKKLATAYEVDATAACTYVFQCTGREYQPPTVQREKVYPAPYTPSISTKKLFSRDQYPEDWYQPPADRDDRQVDWLQLQVDSEKVPVDQPSKKSTAKKTFADKRQKKSSTTLQHIEESSTAVDSPEPERTIEQQQAKTALEADARLMQHDQIDSGDNEKDAKVLRMHVQVDPETYGEEFCNVIRKRNIYILFNNIYNNVTLRSSAAKLLTRLFDNSDSEKICNQNENLLRKYKPEVITTAFIDTLLSMHEPGHDSLQSPGAYFTSRCKYYLAHNADEETQRVVETFSSMRYDELIAEMKRVIENGERLRVKVYRNRTKS